jgi:DNA-binding transcriptional LysR family regulator
MEAPLSLDDIALFLTVADSGGLAAASRLTGVPMPTLSRRMAELERRSGRRLFLRGKKGYALTAEGRGLVEAAGPVRDARACLRHWMDYARAAPRVKITCGVWTPRLVARNALRLAPASAGWQVELMASNADVDIARREADIGIRNRRPEQSWLAGRAAGVVRFAVFGRHDGAAGFVGLPEGAPTTPSERWMRSRHGSEIVPTASDALLAMELARTGVGRVVLPIFAGADEPGLDQLSAPIAEIDHEQWLVSHHDARHDPPVRRALDALHGLLTETMTRHAGR